MAGSSSASYMNYDPRIVEIKSKFECEFRRFSVDRAKLKQFPEFHLLIKDLHCLPDEINFTISYTDPRNGDLLPINNDDNLLRAYTTAMPFLRLFIYREQDLMLEDMSARQRRTKGRYINEHRNKNPLTIGTPQDFRRVSSIVDADLLPETLRRVKLLKHSSDRPLGFYIRDGTSVRVTPYGLEKVPGIFISRLVPGGLAEGTGLLAVNDEILEVNGIDVTGKSLDQVTDMMVANSHNLIITVKPAQQPAATPRAQSMANLSGKPKPTSKGSRKNMDGITQSLKQTSRSQGDIPSAVAGAANTKSSKKNDPDRHSKNSPLRDYTDNGHDKNHIDASRSKGTHDGADTPPLTNDNGIRHNAKHKTNPDQLSLTHSQSGAPTTTHEMS